jgi:hypothetical protein
MMYFLVSLPPNTFNESNPAFSARSVKFTMGAGFAWGLASGETAAPRARMAADDLSFRKTVSIMRREFPRVFNKLPCPASFNW